MQDTAIFSRFMRVDRETVCFFCSLLTIAIEQRIQPDYNNYADMVRVDAQITTGAGSLRTVLLVLCDVLITQQ